MSHVATVDVQIMDLDALSEACQALGLELVRGQTTYRWFGRHVGDYPVPQGFQKSDLGQCSHAIRIPGNPGAYEIGVVERRDGQVGYCLMWDFWNGGKGLQAVVGADCKKLRQEYTKAVTVKALRRQGFRFQTKTEPDGSIKIIAQR